VDTDERFARSWHLVTGAVALLAIVVQFVLALDGTRVLVDETPPTTPETVYRFFAYFTIQSNLLVAASSLMLSRDPWRDDRRWRLVRFAGIVGITVTGLVHFFLLRPLLDLDGLNWWCDKTLHMVVPVLAVAGWALFGPRPRVSNREIVVALVWPIVWVVWTLGIGAAVDWFPYPFLDYREEGWGSVLVVCVGITVLFVVLIALAHWLDRRLPARPPTGDREGVSG
jgi:hypothetical protein